MPSSADPSSNSRGDVVDLMRKCVFFLHDLVEERARREKRLLCVGGSNRKRERHGLVGLVGNT